jgi:hypothetical protein
MRDMLSLFLGPSLQQRPHSTVSVNSNIVIVYGTQKPNSYTTAKHHHHHMHPALSSSRARHPAIQTFTVGAQDGRSKRKTNRGLRKEVFNFCMHNKGLLFIVRVDSRKVSLLKL